MNNMKSKANKNKLQQLSLSIGNFIRYWGFRRIHGSIWTQLYLSRIPLSCTDLTKRLGMSKALISPALDELCSYKLIKEVPSPNEKTKLFSATTNINEVIRNVLKTREALILKQITKDFSNFSEVAEQDETIDPDQVRTLGEMIVAANLMLEILMTQEDLMKLPGTIES
jgi:DNA-binding transcriptional regulator GbsR (MarR family)